MSSLPNPQTAPFPPARLPTRFLHRVPARLAPHAPLRRAAVDQRAPPTGQRVLPASDPGPRRGKLLQRRFPSLPRGLVGGLLRDGSSSHRVSFVRSDTHATPNTPPSPVPNLPDILYAVEDAGSTWRLRFNSITRYSYFRDLGSCCCSLRRPPIGVPPLSLFTPKLFPYAWNFFGLTILFTDTAGSISYL